MVNTSSLDLITGQAAFSDTLPNEEPAEHLHTHHGVQDGLVDLKEVANINHMRIYVKTLTVHDLKDCFWALAIFLDRSAIATGISDGEGGESSTWKHFRFN